MPRNLTPLHLRCGPRNCPSVRELDDGRLLIVGKEVDPYDTGGDELLLDAVNMLLDEQDVGENETVVIIDRTLLDDVVVDAQLTKDLTALVARLCRRLKRFDPDTKTVDDALEFLKRKGLEGSPLRDEGHQDKP